METSYPELQIIESLPNEYSDLSIVKFKKSQHTIGRSPSNSTVIAAVGISRTHCVFSQRPDFTWTIKDLSSASITVNGLEISKNGDYPLRNQDIVKLDEDGTFTYLFQYEPIDSVVEGKNYSSDEETSVCSKTLDFIVDDNLKLKTKKCDSFNKYETNIVDNNTILESINTQQSADYEINRSSTDSVLLHSEKKFRALEDENKKLILELANQKKCFEEKIEEILLFKQKNISDLETALLEEKQSIEKEKYQIAQKTKDEINLLVSNKEIEIKDLKSNYIRCLEQKEKEIAKLNSKIQLFKEALLSEKNKLFISEKQRVKKENEVSELAGKYLAIEGSKKEMQVALNKLKSNLQNLLDAKEKEKETMKANAEAQKRKLDNSTQNEISQGSSSAKRLCDYAEFDKLINSELQCSICGELFIKAILLNCGHTFCKYCVRLWKQKKNTCPVCRATITFECQNIVLDSLIESSLAKLGGNLRSQRLQCIQERADKEIIDRQNQERLSSHSRRRRYRRRYR